MVIIPSDADDSLLLISLMLQEVTSYFPAQAATLTEFDSDVILKFHLTTEALVWNPCSSSYSWKEDYMLDFRGLIVSNVITTRGQITMQLNAVCSSPFASYSVVDATDVDIFGIYLESFVQISLTSTSRRAAVSNDMLAKHWGIHPDCAKSTVQCTTQRDVRTIANLPLSRHFWTNDHML